MTAILRAPAAAAMAAALAGCFGSTGDGVVSPPPAPPLDGVVGEGSSGGTIDESSTYEGDFRGPLALAQRAPGAADLSVAVAPKPAAGDPGDVYVSVETAAGGEVTLTLFLDGETAAFDFAQAQIASMAGGFLTREQVRLQADGVTWDASDIHFSFDGRQREYSQLLVFLRSSASGDGLVGGALTFGSDVIDMPTTGEATYDTGVAGFYLETAQSAAFTPFVGRGEVAVRFGPGTVSGSFADVDFVDAAGGMVETANGVDFGLDMTATITGDDFAGTMTAVGAAMSGDVQGDFYGPLDGNPLEIGGAFAMDGADGLAFGGLQGVCTCLAGTN